MGALSPDLARWQKEIEAVARSYGLDFFEVRFEVVTYDQMNEFAAYGGFPNRYPHWRFGMEYEKLAKGYAYGLAKIYEMVINNDPCYAYLMESNNIVDQKMVMAHVYGHCDFFKNNLWFAHTNRRMMDEMGNHGARIRRYAERHGEAAAEEFLDLSLSVEDLIDRHSPHIRRREEPAPRLPSSGEDEEAGHAHAAKFPSKEYLDDFVNPREALAREEERLRTEEESRSEKFPASPERDVLLFLLEHAPLKPWQQHILGMIREEACYFAPQGMTKVMNEGWASFFHSQMMTRNLARDADIVEYADHHSGTMGGSPGGLNPYKLGIELYREIEERWNRGRFGKEYEECEDLERKANWDTQAGLGRAKIFEVRRVHNDLTFLDEFFTEEFCRRHRFFTYALNKDSEAYEIESREFPAVKERLLTLLTNFGRPIIEVEEGNYQNRGELLLRHLHEGRDLKVDYGRETLRNLFRLWKRPVHIRTILRGKPKILGYDGRNHEEREG